MTKRLTTAAVVLCLAGASAPAQGATSSPVVADCVSHGRLTHQYSVSELHTALTVIPVDTQEYTNCYAVIQHALLAQVSASHPGTGSTSQGSSGGSFLPLPVIVVLAVLVASAAGFGVYAVARR